MGAKITWSKTREEDVSHFHNRFVAKTTKDQRAHVFVARQQVAQPGAQRPCASRVMRHVENPLSDFAILRVFDADGLKAGGPACVANTLGQRLRGNGKPVAYSKLDRGGHSQRDVSMLVSSPQRRSDLDRMTQGLNCIATLRFAWHARSAGGM